MNSFATSNLLPYLVMFLQVFIVYSGNQQGDSVWKTTEACYGADHRCSTYKMKCGQKQKIALGTLLYGTKHSIGPCLYGVSDCPKSAIICCKYNGSDTLTPFSESDRAKVSENCSGKDNCEGLAPRLSSIPYSVYVIMNYTCVDDTSTVKFCEASHSLRVTHSFLEFNLPRDSAFPSINGSRDCSCMVIGQSCDSGIDITHLVMDFEKPVLSTGSAGCSDAFISDKRLGSSFNCSSIHRGDGASFTVTSYDVISIRDLFSLDYNDRPTHILILVKAHSGGYIDVRCGQPGVSFDPQVNCPTTSISVSPTSTMTQITSTSTTTNSPFVTPKALESLSPSTYTRTSTTPLSTTRSIFTSRSTSPSRSTTITSIPSTTSRISLKPTRTRQTTTRQTVFTSSKAGISTSKSPLSSSTPFLTTIQKHYTSHTAFTSKQISKSSHIMSKTTGAPFSPNGMQYTLNSPTTQSTVADSLYVTHPSTTTYFTATTETKVVPTIDDDSIDKGLIIGLIVGIIAALTIIVGVIVCLCIRVKRKEKYRRNYVRNTNIFYSFPEDLKDIGSTESDCKTAETIEKDNALIIETNAMFEPFDGVEKPYDTYPEFDISNYIIEPSVSNPKIVLVSGDVYSPESSTDSDNEINEGVYNANVDKDTRTDTSKVTTAKSDTKAGKDETVVTVPKKSPRKNSRVAFDPTTLYASVNKEGKTKF